MVVRAAHPCVLCHVCIYALIAHARSLAHRRELSLPGATLLPAAQCGRAFTAVVVDSRPLLEGRRMLRELTEGGVPCQYAQLNALHFAMGQATKVGAGCVGGWGGWCRCGERVWVWVCRWLWLWVRVPGEGRWCSLQVCVLAAFHPAA
jgi:hypothetical protein